MKRRNNTRTIGDNANRTETTTSAGSSSTSVAIKTPRVTCKHHGELSEDEHVTINRSQTTICLICIGVALQKLGVSACSVEYT